MSDGRLITIGDIHGCSVALATLIEAIQPTPLDTLVFLGDYIDRGPESRLYKLVPDAVRGYADYLR